MKKLAAALTLALLSQSLLAAEWYLVAANSKAAFFVDKSSLSRSGTKVKFWTWTITKDATGDPLSDNFKVLETADCKNRTLIPMHYQYFYGNNSVGSETPKKGTIEHVMPDSSLETIFQAVCIGKFSGAPTSKISVDKLRALMTEY